MEIVAILGLVVNVIYTVFSIYFMMKQH